MFNEVMELVINCSRFQNLTFTISHKYIWSRCRVMNETDPFLWLPVENEGTLKYLAKVYAHNHPRMHLGDTGCSNNGQSRFKKKKEF